VQDLLLCILLSSRAAPRSSHAPTQSARGLPTRRVRSGGVMGQALGRSTASSQFRDLTDRNSNVVTIEMMRDAGANNVRNRITAI